MGAVIVKGAKSLVNPRQASHSEVEGLMVYAIGRLNRLIRMSRHERG